MARYLMCTNCRAHISCVNCHMLLISAAASLISAATTCRS